MKTHHLIVAAASCLAVVSAYAQQGDPLQSDPVQQREALGQGPSTRTSTIVRQAQQKLKQHGFEVSDDEAALARDQRFAGSDEERPQAVQRVAEQGESGAGPAHVGSSGCGESGQPWYTAAEVGVPVSAPSRRSAGRSACGGRQRRC